MEIKQLEYFRTIVEEGTISGAARVLHMTQPPLSYQMKMLEEELQVQLFCRGTKKITLTEAGRVLYTRSGSLLTMADITKREVIKTSQAATIHLGMTPSTVLMMAGQLKRFMEHHPEIHFDIHDGTTFTLKSQLENRLVDITTLRTPIALGGFCSKTLAREPLLAMTAKERMDGEAHALDLTELSRQRIILSRRYRKYVLSALEDAGLPGDIYYECEDARTALTLAENGLGTAILPASMRQLSEKTCAREIHGTDFVTEILLVWRDEKLPAEVQMFLEEFELEEGER